MKNASESDPCIYEATKTVAKKGPEKNSDAPPVRCSTN